MTLRKRGKIFPHEKVHEICPLELDKYHLYRKIPGVGSIDITTHQPVSRDLFLPYDADLEEISPGKLEYLLTRFEDEIEYYKRLLDKSDQPGAPQSYDLRDTPWKYRRPHHEKFVSLDNKAVKNGTLWRNHDLYYPRSDGGPFRRVTIDEMIEYYQRKATIAEQRLAFLGEKSRTKHGEPHVIYTKHNISPTVEEVGQEILRQL